ncbi:MAG: amylo-alpha-1,6-glucosidase [Pseudomonadota bacterium]
MSAPARLAARSAALAALAALLALPAARASIPAAGRFFDDMAIAVKPGQQARFVVGDNLDGYFEAYTHSYSKGEGYVSGPAPLFQSYASFIDGAQNERADASESVLPYGHRVRYANGAAEEMALLSKKHALAMRVSNPRAVMLSIRPILKADAQSVKITSGADVVVIAPSAAVDGAQYMALAADRPFRADADLTLRTLARTRSFTVVAAFGASAEQATRRARALARTAPIEAEKLALYATLSKSYLATSDARYNKALNWAKAASGLFVVEQYGSGIWAGLPWFRDNWGRDSFIALPGTLLAAGRFAQAKEVLLNFARYQNLREPRDQHYGRIPNRVAAGRNIIYNTVDGTPWMLREALEYVRYTGDREFAAAMYKLAVPYFEGAIANYVDADGLLTHDDADTWMDARIDGKQPWSARGPRAVEIQALWYTALQSGAYLAFQAGDQARASQWQAMAHKAQQSFARLFWDGQTMADRLRADASRDLKVRPNQLMLLSVPFDDFVAPSVQAKVLRNAVSELLYPYGVASLSQNDPYFHPRHENAAFHHKDAAYHQGTVWGWNAGFTITGLNKFGYQDLAWTLSRNLGEQILGLGTLGTMSELLDALPGVDGTPHPSGTFAQSWSVAEYVRNAYQDYVGFKPELLENTLAFSPAIPEAWSAFHAVLPFGPDGAQRITVDFSRTHDQQLWRLRLAGGPARKVRFCFLNADKSRSQLSFDMRSGTPVLLALSHGQALLNGKALAPQPRQASFAATIGKLEFVAPRAYREQDFPMLQSRDALKGLIERGEYR